MLFDTDVLIWHLRGHPKASALVSVHAVRLSAVTYMELVRGMRNRDELNALRRTVRRHQWRLLPIDEQISSRATAYVEAHFLAHALTAADALIAATCVEYGEALATANVKHFRPIDDLAILPFQP